MRLIFNCGVILLSVCLFGANMAVAQRPPGGNPNLWHNSVGLLGWIKVRDELKLTADQVEKIREIGDECIEKYERPLGESLAKLTAEERRQKFAELEQRQEEAAEKAKGELTPEQSARLRQIEIWTLGPLAFSKPDLIQDLDLTDDQKGALKTIGDEYDNEMRALVKSNEPNLRTRPTREEMSQRAKEMKQKREELRAAKEAECLFALTDDQKARFEKLRGQKYELLGEPRPARQ